MVVSSIGKSINPIGSLFTYVLLICRAPPNWIIWFHHQPSTGRLSAQMSQLQKKKCRVSGDMSRPLLLFNLSVDGFIVGFVYAP